MRERSRVHVVALPSDPLRLRDARRWIARLAIEAGFESSDVHDLAVAFSEAAANVHRHAYGGRGDGPVSVGVAIEDDRVVVTIEHRGAAFDPGSYRPPNLQRPSESGYGLYLIARLVDDVAFEDAAAGGRVVLVKRRRPAGVRA